ncbi:hypothetical protein ZIOFF_053100 [Zingiber officinale]|uniref:Integrase catalytic domain-containing protein n=1 Tax=Zingiber officinale TaxID=94328 RepID=A0A8J5KPN7_ZINOF|nr:hypothetical protein ZIOFF_053100 [Zingiber officinale]
MVQGLPHIEGKQHVCEGCVFGKQHRLPFPKGVSWRAKEKLELIHTDVCGPMDTLSHAQNRYFILFIDDHTRMTWVYFMRQKSEVFMIFKKFKSLVEKQSGCFIKTLRSDRGKEYTSKEFHNFCEDEGVERQLTVRYTPQQNGVTERKNQTIVEMAKSMMHEKGLPKIFWVKQSTQPFIYLIDAQPQPYQTRLRLKHGVLGQVIISRDVQVDENALWNWEENKVEKKDILISTDKEDEIEPSTPDSSSSQPNEESSTDPTSSNSSSPSATPKSNEKMIEEFKDDMAQKYEMSDMGLLRYFLGMEIYQEEETIFICQKIYAEKILKKFNMLGCNPVSTPLIMGEKLKKEDGGKAWMSLITVASLSPSHFHLGAAKRVLRYVQGTTDLGLSFQKNHALNLVGYCDSDFGGSLDDMKSTSGYCFSFGSAIFSWVSKKQQSVAQSSAEAEYISASVATSQAIWLRKILADLGHHQIEGTVLHCDNKSAIAMAKNPVHHNRTRHIALKHHFIRQAIEDKEIQLEFSIESKPIESATAGTVSGVQIALGSSPLLALLLTSATIEAVRRLSSIVQKYYELWALLSGGQSQVKRQRDLCIPSEATNGARSLQSATVETSSHIDQTLALTGAQDLEKNLKGGVQLCSTIRKRDEKCSTERKRDEKCSTKRRISEVPVETEFVGLKAKYLEATPARPASRTYAELTQKGKDFFICRELREVL